MNKLLDQNLPNIPHDLHTVRLFKDDLQKFRSAYSDLLTFASYVLGIPREKITLSDLLFYQKTIPPIKRKPASK